MKLKCYLYTAKITEMALYDFYDKYFWFCFENKILE